jgi:hypothetical protein
MGETYYFIVNNFNWFYDYIGLSQWLTWIAIQAVWWFGGDRHGWSYKFWWHESRCWMICVVQTGHTEVLDNICCSNWIYWQRHTIHCGVALRLLPCQSFSWIHNWDTGIHFREWATVNQHPPVHHPPTIT